MKFPARPLAFLIVFAAFTVGGCSTFEKRALEKTAVFAALDVPTQARLKDGRLEIGDTVDMAYIALGEPDEKRDQVTAEGNAVVWIYRARWEEYRGEAVVGYRPITVTDPKTGTPIVLYQPVERAAYREREEERLRVTFKDGKVSVLERPRP